MPADCKIRDSKRRDRLPAGLTQRLEGELMAYVAAGAGLVSIALPSHAQIVYTPSNIPLAQRSVTQLDVNNDGVPDFRFVNFESVRYCCTSNSGTGGIRTASTYYLKVAPDQTGNGVVQIQLKGQQVTAAALPKGAQVGPSAAFNSQILNMAILSQKQNSGSWQGVQTAYLGLKFVISGEVHYGWVLVKFARPGGVSRGFISGSVYGYAYESTPEQPIITGQTGEASDDAKPIGASDPVGAVGGEGAPGTLGLLATGAQGLEIWRGAKNSPLRTQP